MPQYLTVRLDGTYAAVGALDIQKERERAAAGYDEFAYNVLGWIDEGPNERVTIRPIKIVFDACEHDEDDYVTYYQTIVDSETGKKLDEIAYTIDARA